jgi:hypothetical protein
MKVVLNPLLQGMSVDDLNQRYRNTFIDYDGKVRNCHSFTPDGANTRIMFANPDGASLELFDWQKLNTYRPRPRWFEYRSTSRRYPICAAYRVARQWHRGFCDTTIRLYNATTQAYASLDAVLPTFLYGESKPKRSYTEVEALALTKKYGHAILSDNLCLVGRDGVVKLWYKQAQIGAFNNEGTLVLHKPEFEQEYAECLKS